MIRSTTLIAIGSLVACLAMVGCSEGGGGADATGGQSGNAGASKAGEDIYNRSCFSCHAAGVAGAPKTGDAAAWAPRIAKGPELLLESTKTGIPPGMPPMGMCMSCSDEDLAAAIEYMINLSR